MNTTEITEQIIKELARLSPEYQRLVLDFARGLRPLPQNGVPGRDLIRFSGVFGEDEAGEIEQAIEEGCEQVDAGEW